MTKRRSANQKVPVREGPSGRSKKGSAETLSPLQIHYLGLLEHSINLKNSYQSDPGREEWLLKAINKAAYSAFRSCTENGIEGQARILLGIERQAN